MTSTDPRDDLTQIATASELRDVWPLLSAEERHPTFDQLPRTEREDFFISLSAREQARMLLEFPPHRRRVWMRLLPPDDAADLIQEAPPRIGKGCWNSWTISPGRRSAPCWPTPRTRREV